MKIGTLIIRIGMAAFVTAMAGIAAARPAKPPLPGAADVAKSIRAQDVGCPTVMSVASRGQDAYGRVFRVRCGPVPGAKRRWLILESDNTGEWRGGHHTGAMICRTVPSSDNVVFDLVKPIGTRRWLVGEPVMFNSRREARDWCVEHHPGSPIREVGANAKRQIRLDREGCCMV